MGRVRKKRRVKRIGSLKCLRAVFVGVGGRGRGVEEVRPGRTRGSRRWPGLGASEGRRTRSGAVPDQDRSFGEIGYVDYESENGVFFRRREGVVPEETGVFGGS